ncbi:hypothetical protein [Nocardia nova]|nr:hypothetical protein [Nocardia nova]
MHSKPSARAQVRESNVRTDAASLWVRSAQGRLEYLVSGKAISAEAQAKVEFAIRWAPFGGSNPGDLLVNFGVDRQRFLTLLEDGLRIHRYDDPEQRRLKRRLSDVLIAAWGGECDTGAPRW